MSAFTREKMLGPTLALFLSSLASQAVAADIVEYIHTDALGSPVAVTDTAGNVVERTVYQPYGEVVNRSAYDGPGFTGHVSDELTGLVQMQQRYYDSSIGRFISVDPILTDGSTGDLFNRYGYANGNPYSFIDPDGRAPGNSILMGPGGRTGGEVTAYSPVSEYDDDGNYSGGDHQNRKAPKVTVGSVISIIIQAQLEPVRKINASGTTMLGLAIGQARLYEAWMRGNKPYVDFGNNSIQYHNLSSVFGNHGAITFGNNIQYTLGSAPGDRQIASGKTLGYEEMQHTRQAEVLGLSYLPINVALGISASIYQNDWHGSINYLEVGPHSKEPNPWP